MTDNEIIKALECCNQEDMCDQCPYDFACYDEKYKSILSKDALDLINRQKAEIERLRKETSQTIESIRKLARDTIRDTKSEAIKELEERVQEIFVRYAHLHNYADIARLDEIECADGTKIEMQSVWDVLALQKNGMAEYEEMNQLQTNIETIEKGRLLTELEKDFRLLVNELTHEPTKIEHNSLCETETYESR